MTETEQDRYLVTGLYEKPETFRADDEADARRQYHDKHAGLRGTVLRVAKVEPK